MLYELYQSSNGDATVRREFSVAKITKFDLAVVGVTLAFLLGIGLYCWKTSMTTQPYRVEVSQREEIAPAEDGERPAQQAAGGGDH